MCLPSIEEEAEKNLGKLIESRTDKSADPSALKQQITLLTEELEESRKKLVKVQNEKKKENHSQSSK